MNIKKTIIFALIFGLLAGFYYWDHNRFKANETRKESEIRLVAPKKDEVSELTIQRGAQTVKLVKQGKEWTLAEPLKTRADDSAVTGVLDELDRAKKADAFDLGANAKIEDYGLKSPEIKAEIKAVGANYVQNFELGSTTSSGDEIYARAGKDPKIFTVPVALKTQLTKPVPDLRDKRLLPANLNEATSLTLAFGGKTIDLAKHGNDWSMNKPITGPADPAKITEGLRQFSSPLAADFIDTKPLDLAKLGLTSPTLTATVTVPTDNAATATVKAQTMTMLVGAAVPGKIGHYYGMQQGGDYAYVLPQAVVDALEPKLDDLRSKQLFTLKSQDVGRAIFNVRGTAIDLTRDSAGKWHFADDPKSKLDDSMISARLGELTGLKATKFFDDATSPVSPAQSGLDNPNLRLTIASKDGKTTESIITGKKAENGDFVYARQGNTTQTLAIDWQQPGRFFVTRDELLNKGLYDFDAGLAEKVVLQDGPKKITLTREKSGGWIAKPDGTDKTFQVESTRMSAFNYGISSLKWSRKLDPAYPNDLTIIKSQGLENPARVITLFDAQGKELAQLGQGNGNAGGGAKNFVYIHRAPGDYYALDAMAFGPVKSALDKITGDLGWSNPVPVIPAGATSGTAPVDMMPVGPVAPEANGGEAAPGPLETK